MSPSVRATSPQDDPDGRPTAGPGLRERSKAKRRTAIQHAAMRLFSERGYEATTIADIAEAAEVAPRTVTGYFPAKVDLATAYADAVAARLTAAFERCPDADIVTALVNWLDDEEQALDAGAAGLALDMYEANPELGALSSGQLAEALAVGSAALSRELGVPADHPLAEACAAAIGGVTSTYVRTMMRGKGTAELRQWVADYLRVLVKAAKPT